MNYTTSELAKLSGLTPRTLRYYDKIGLLSPKRNEENDYRMYSGEDVDLLQQILFYRELGVELSEIKKILYAKDFDPLVALDEHLALLSERKRKIDALITTVKKTISEKKGELKMKNEEKFEAFKEKLIQDNEQKYGKEIREKYGDETVDKSHQSISSMTKEEYEHWKTLEEKIKHTLKKAVEDGDHTGPLAKELCKLHEEWITLSWGTYSKVAHLGLAKLYVEDPRFSAYYDDVVKEGAEFLLKALEFYLE